MDDYKQGMGQRIKKQRKAVSIDYIVKGEADCNRWYSVINALDNVPPEKEMLIRNLLTTGIELAK